MLWYALLFKEYKILQSINKMTIWKKTKGSVKRGEVESQCKFENKTNMKYEKIWDNLQGDHITSQSEKKEIAEF